MKRSELLKRAYQLVRQGWARESVHAHGCTSEMGNPRPPTDDGAANFSVIGAVLCAAGVNNEWDSDLVRPALELLEQVHAALSWTAQQSLDSLTPEVFDARWPQVHAELAAARRAGEKPMREWLEAPERTRQDVLLLLMKAQQRAVHLERTGR